MPENRDDLGPRGDAGGDADPQIQLKQRDQKITELVKELEAVKQQSGSVDEIKQQLAALRSENDTLKGQFSMLQPRQEEPESDPFEGILSKLSDESIVEQVDAEPGKAVGIVRDAIGGLTRAFRDELTKKDAEFKNLLRGQHTVLEEDFGTKLEEKTSAVEQAWRKYQEEAPIREALEANKEVVDQLKQNPAFADLDDRKMLEIVKLKVGDAAMEAPFSIGGASGKPSRLAPIGAKEAAEIRQLAKHHYPNDEAEQKKFIERMEKEVRQQNGRA